MMEIVITKLGNNLLIEEVFVRKKMKKILPFLLRRRNRTVAICISIVFFVLILAILPIYGFAKEKEALQSLLEKKVETDVKSYLNDVTLSENVINDVTTGTISSDSQIAFESKIAEIVKDSAKDEDKAAKEDALNRMIRRADSLVMSYFNDLEEDELAKLKDALEAIILADTKLYVEELINLYQNPEHMSFVSANYETRIKKLEEKLYSIQKAYDVKLNNMEATLAEKINKVEDSNRELKSEIEKAKSESDESIKSVLESLIQTQDNLADSQRYDDERITENANNISALEDKLQESQQHSSDTDYIDSNNNILRQFFNSQNDKLTQFFNSKNDQLREHVDSQDNALTQDFNSKNNQLREHVDSQNDQLRKHVDSNDTKLKDYINDESIKTQEGLEKAVLTLEKEIATLQAEIDELNRNKLNISDSPNYQYEESPDSSGINIVIPQTNPNLSGGQ